MPNTGKLILERGSAFFVPISPCPQASSPLRWAFYLDSRMSTDHIAQVAERGGAAVAASGIVAWVADYASVLTLLIGLAGLIVAVLGHRWKRRVDQHLIALAEERRREESRLHAARMAQLSKD